MLTAKEAFDIAQEVGRSRSHQSFTHEMDKIAILIEEAAKGGNYLVKVPINDGSIKRDIATYLINIFDFSVNRQWI